MNKIKLKINADAVILFICLLFALVRDYVWFLVITVVSRFGVRMTIEMFDWIILIVLAVLVFPTMLRRLKTGMFITYLVLVLTALIFYVALGNKSFTVTELCNLIFAVMPFMLYGSVLRMDENTGKILYIMSVIALGISAIYIFYYLSGGRIVAEDNMDYAYNVLPPVLVIISRAFLAKKKALAIVLSVLGSVFLLLQGTRGPILCLVIFIVFMLYKKYGFTRIVVAVCAVSFVFSLIFNMQAVQQRMLIWTQRIDSSGFSSRVLTMFISDDIADDNGRDYITEVLMNDIKENPFAIRGLYSDRDATVGVYDTESTIRYDDGTYAHNINLEFVYDFGVIPGSILLIFIFACILRLFKKTSLRLSGITNLFVCIGFVYLFMSGSYLQTREFFFLLGLAFNPYFVSGGEKSTKALPEMPGVYERSVRI